MLQRWSGSQELIIVNHFFWSAGTKLQKSQTGLFRTLLFQIFSQCPKIIPEVCPSRCSDNSHAWLESWERTELFGIFNHIATLEHLSGKICLFIDGLDEYDGDHVELVEILRTMAKSAHIKICASSRPWYDFIDAFGGQKWKLSVQDLTANDILLYVKDNLEQDPQFQTLKNRDVRAATMLVEEIHVKSYGVFLWVFLVVRSLLRGLRNVDKISHLRRRLYELPSELETYFELMLDSIEKVYQQTTAQIFKVMVTAQGTLPVIAFHFLDREESHSRYALDEFEPIPPNQLDILINEKKRQLHANCRDLLWISPRITDEDEIVSHRVGFLHRTVIDFLQTKHMDTLLSTRAGKTFQPTTSLSMMYLAMVKTHVQRRTHRAETTQYLTLGVIFYARESEKVAEIAEEAVLDELELFTKANSINWQNISHTNDCNTWQSYIVRADLRHYVSKKLQSPSNGDLWDASDILRHALLSRVIIEQDLDFTSRVENKLDLSMVRFLLASGVSPNAKLLTSNETVWSEFIIRLAKYFAKGVQGPTWNMNNFIGPSAETLQYSEDGGVRNYAKLPKAVWLTNWYEACEIMISHGATEMVNVKFASQPKPQYKRISATDVLSDVFRSDQVRALQQLYRSKDPPKSLPTWSKIVEIFWN